MAKRERTISIPVSVLMTVSDLDELEDWLLANNPEFVADLERIHEQEAGTEVTLEELERRWRTKS